MVELSSLRHFVRHRSLCQHYDSCLRVHDYDQLNFSCLMTSAISNTLETTVQMIFHQGKIAGNIMYDWTVSEEGECRSSNRKA
jgi:hypothetical protein